MNVIALLTGLLLATAPEGRLIGQVGQQPVYESQIKGDTESAREQSLRVLFIRPVIKAYLDAHRSQWQLTEQEILQLVTGYREWQKCHPPGPSASIPDFERTFAKFIGENLKVQRFIYERHGGGRILFQQAGTEAYDATRNLILSLEKEGAFKITDPALRAKALNYWLGDNQTNALPDPGPEKAFKLDQAFERCPQ